MNTTHYTATSEQLRQLAESEDALAKAATRTGDFNHAVLHKRQADEYRKKARAKELH